MDISLLLLYEKLLKYNKESFKGNEEFIMVLNSWIERW